MGGTDTQTERCRWMPPWLAGTVGAGLNPKPGLGMICGTG
jgi:hypothetical protein